jgi:DNA-binding response OmpR family regulator
MLYYLLKNKGIVVTRDMLLENVWDYEFDGGTNAVDVYIRFLRGKIDEGFNIKLIHTVRGVGYVIRDE